MKRLIVNADDFGAGHGVNRGIVAAHLEGILTSTSLMVDLPTSAEAAAMSRDARDLSVGLHVHLDETSNWSDRTTELLRQLRRFEELMGRPPTHIDSHHNIHRDPALLPDFLELANRCGVPLRGHSPARCVSSFYGRWGGETHREQIDVPGLSRLLAAEVREGVTELSCHPGYVDLDLRSSYSAEREIELRTLCDPEVRRVLDELGINLISFRDLRTNVRL